MEKIQMKNISLLGIAGAITVAAALIFVGTGARAEEGTLSTCANAITACGCEITASGTYAVSNALTSSSASADCIDIKAKNVTLYTAGFAITGPGGAATGIGINILSSAKNANVQFAPANDLSHFTLVSKFGTGIQTAASNTTLFDFESETNAGAGLVILKSAGGSTAADFDTDDNHGAGITISGAPNCLLDDFSSDDNTGDGIEMTGVKGARFIDFSADDNQSKGIAVSSSSGNSFGDFSADDNSGNNIELDKSSGNTIGDFSADDGGKSGVLLSGSSSNQVVDCSADDNAVYGIQLQGSSKNLVSYCETDGNTQTGTYLGCATTGGPTGSACGGVAASSSNRVNGMFAGKSGSTPQEFGIAIDPGDSSNLVTGSDAPNNSTKDLIDENANCGSNIWAVNSATTSSPGSCIATTP